MQASLAGDSAPVVNLAGGVMVADGMSFTQYDMLGSSGAWFVANRRVYTIVLNAGNDSGGDPEPDPEQGPL